MSRQAWIVLGAVVAVVAVVTLVWAVRLLLRLFAVRRVLYSMGAKGKLVFWGAVLYTIFPIDILPDPIYLDDVTVLTGALWFLTRLVQRQAGLAEAPAHADRLAAIATRPRRPAGSAAGSTYSVAAGVTKDRRRRYVHAASDESSITA
jgi:uncharacterized membrane protein YkvA (DUF1232 family)